MTGFRIQWMWLALGSRPCLHALCSREAEKKKPGFIPPRELDKHTPLIKSHSMTSIQKGRGKDEPPVVLRPTKSRSKVQRTQSVPTQNKAARRMHKHNSTEHVAEGRGSSPRPGISNLCSGNNKASPVIWALSWVSQTFKRGLGG